MTHTTRVLLILLVPSLCSLPAIAAIGQNLAMVDKTDVKAGHRLVYSGDTMPDGQVFSNVILIASRHHVVTLPDGASLDTSFFWLGKNMGIERNDAAILAAQLRELGPKMQVAADQALLDEACGPEATEWWPDSQAVHALSQIQPIRNRVYEEYYHAFLETLNERDKSKFKAIIENTTAGVLSVENYAVTFADRPEEAQQILVDFCRSLAQ